MIDAMSDIAYYFYLQVGHLNSIFLKRNRQHSDEIFYPQGITVRQNQCSMGAVIWNAALTIFGPSKKVCNNC